jgi:hypothetical protein
MFREFRENHETKKSPNEDLEKQNESETQEIQESTVDHEHTLMAITEALHEMETQLIFPNDKILCAAEDPDFRHKHLSIHSPNTNSIEKGVF